jgi:hypothetical protein
LTYPGSSKEYREEIAKAHFKQALGNATLREELFRAKPDTMDEAITIVERMESFLRSEEKRAKSDVDQHAAASERGDEAVVQMKPGGETLVTRMLTMDELPENGNVSGE